MPVVSGSSARVVAEGLADEIGWQHHSLEARRFPDSEGYVRVPAQSIEAIRSEAVVLVATTFPDQVVLETLFMLEAINDVRRGELSSLRDGLVESSDVGPGIILAIPYYGYSRQDKRFQPGEPVTARFLARVLSRGCDGLVLLDLHAQEAVTGISIPVALTSAMPEIASHIRTTIEPDYILSPDEGAIERARAVAEMIGVPFSHLEKRRIDAHTIEHTPKDLDVKGKVVVIVDDMISTGGTICKASDALRRQGATAVHAACTHGLFTGGAIPRLASHVDGVHATDSLPNPRAVVSCAPALARGVRQVLDELAAHDQESLVA